MKKTFLFVALLMAILSANTVKAQELYRDMNAPMHERIMDLLGRMTVEEKAALLHASSPGVERLGIPKYYMGNEALHGVVRPGQFTVFPQAIGLASMWNPDLHYQIATAISDEARAKWNLLERGKLQKDLFSDLMVFWSPTVNMARDPRWGRTPETYGEDPYLSGVLGTAFVKGLQGNDPRYLKVVATPKHFAANNEEHNRFECNPQISERDLREYYFPAFERCIREGKAESIMSAYNAINDVPCTVNPWLLKTVLRDEWGFDGYVVSDCGGPALVLTHHKFVKLPETSAALGLKAGLDLECGDQIYIEPLLSAYRQNMITTADIDSAAYHVLRSKMRLGVFDDPERIPYNHLDPAIVGCDKHHQLALEAARQSIVLLKNSKKALPLNAKKLKKIAVVGINAANCELGDYSGSPVHDPISVLDGIRQRVGKDVEVYTSPWKSFDAEHPQLLSGDVITDGFHAEYFDNKKLEGTPRTRIDQTINYEPQNQAPDPFLPTGDISVRWTGKITAPVTGEYTLSVQVDDGARLWLDGKRIINDWKVSGQRSLNAKVNLVAGREYDIKMEYFDGGGEKLVRLNWSIPCSEEDLNLDMYEAGLEKNIRQSDAVIAVMGINKSIEREGQDRSSIELPNDQQLFIKKLYEANPNTILVLIAGSSLAVGWEDEHLPAIVDAWYGGEQTGTAVAEVLFGDYNPAGRLPLTFYRSMDDLPAFDDYNVDNNRTYQYFTGKPLYAFGHGLSYTSFRYRNVNVNTSSDAVNVALDVENNGGRDGDEVVQVYVQYPEQQGRKTPLKQLRAFKRINVKHGKREHVELSIPRSELRLWDDTKKAFFTPAGTYRVMVGKAADKIEATMNIDL